MVTITIDGHSHQVEAGKSMLEILRSLNYQIPALCYHPSLKPSGSCKLCAVEVPGRTKETQVIMLACILRSKEGMTIRTTGERVDRARSKAIRNLLQMAPQAEAVLALARQYNIDTGKQPDGCIRCRLCIRVCKEIVGPAALKMMVIEGRDYVVARPGQCIGCGTCANICPTRAITVSDEADVRTIQIRDEVIGRHPLERCEGCGKRFATPKFLHHVHDRTSGHTDVKAHHQYCPTCAKLFSERIGSIRKRTQQ